MIYYDDNHMSHELCGLILVEDRLLGEIDQNWKVDNNYVTSKIVRYVLQNNYTTNRDAIIQAIKYLYTYWPDPRNDDRVRQEYLKVRRKIFSH